MNIYILVFHFSLLDIFSLKRFSGVVPSVITKLLRPRLFNNSFWSLGPEVATFWRVLAPIASTIDLNFVASISANAVAFSISNLLRPF